MAFHRGAEGRKRTDSELARQKERSEQRKKQGNMPFRFYTPVGETRQIIICDDVPDFFQYEHNLPGPDKKYRTFTGCIKEDMDCPVCESQDKESYYAMYLTVIDLTPFSTKGGDEVEFSRKLLVVKPGQQKKFLRFYEKNGTLRGALFDMTRDGEKDASIGNDIEFVEFVEEAEMETYTRSWKDKDGKKQTEVCHEPYVYEDLFEEPTEENLRALVGGRPSPGSRAADDAALGRPARSRGTTKTREAATDDWEDDTDQRTYAGDKKPARTRKSSDTVGEEPPARTVRRGRQEEEPEEQEEPARRPARGAPARGRDDTQRVTRRPRTEEPEEADEPETPPRRAARTSAESTRAPATRRGAAVEDDDPPFDPDPPRRGREAVADEDSVGKGAPRRASLRGRR